MFAMGRSDVEDDETNEIIIQPFVFVVVWAR